MQTLEDALLALERMGIRPEEIIIPRAMFSYIIRKA